MMELHHLAGRPSRCISHQLRHCVPLLDRRLHARSPRTVPATQASSRTLPASTSGRTDPASSGFSGQTVRHGKSANAGRGQRIAAEAGAQSQPIYTTLWTSYARSVETNPVPTKAATSFMGFVIGDLLAQRIAGEPFSALRMLRLGTYGLLIDGPIGHAWYKFLDRVVYPDKPQSTAAVLIKTAADQLVWAPIMTIVFFALLKTLEGHPELIAATIQDKLVKTVVANYILWPAAHFINFRFVPNQHRILYNNCVSIVWNCFLSTLSHAPSFDIHQLSGVVDEADGLLSQWGHATAVSPPEPLSAVIAQAQELLSQYLPQAPAIELPNIKLEVPSVIELQPTHSQPF